MKSNNFFEHVGTKNLKTGYLSLFNFIKLTHQTIVSIIARLQHFTLRWNNYILRDDGGGGLGFLFIKITIVVYLQCYTFYIKLLCKQSDLLYG